MIISTTLKVSDCIHCLSSRIISIIASANSEHFNLPPRSPVFAPSDKHLKMAFSICLPYIPNPICVVIMQALSSNAIGLALFCPAMSGAVPCTASNRAIPSVPMFPLGVTPRPPIKPIIQLRGMRTVTKYSRSVYDPIRAIS